MLQGIKYLKMCVGSSGGVESRRNAMYELAMIYRDGADKVLSDVMYSVKLIKEAAKLKHGKALFEIGEWHRYGLNGYHKSLRKAIKHYAESATRESAYVLAGCLINGVGVGQDVDRGVEMLVSSANDGYPKAQFALGCIHGIGGLGLRQSLYESRKWLRLAAEQKLDSEVADLANKALEE